MGLPRWSCCNVSRPLEVVKLVKGQSDRAQRSGLKMASFFAFHYTGYSSLMPQHYRAVVDVVLWPPCSLRDRWFCWDQSEISPSQKLHCGCLPSRCWHFCTYNLINSTKLSNKSLRFVACSKSSKNAGETKVVVLQSSCSWYVPGPQTPFVMTQYLHRLHRFHLCANFQHFVFLLPVTFETRIMVAKRNATMP